MSEKSEKYAVISVLVGAALIMFACFYSIHQAGLRDEARHKFYQDACKALDVRLGDSLAVKTGPYRGVEMVAIRFGEESIEVYPVVPALLFLPQAQRETTLRFTCDEFEVLKKRVD